MESSSSSGQSKRSRAPIMGVQTVACLVDGCTADLSGCKDYHRRHKVCELHSKSPKVTIGGHEQRFCQQCSRFHSLEEFDEVKRSCRKRLDGHNRRRRKPQLESSSMNSGSFLSNHEGTKYLNFGDPQVFPTSDQVLYGGHSQLNFFASQSSSIGSFSHSYKGGRKKQPQQHQQQFPFLHGTSPDFPEASSVAMRTFLDPECCNGVNRERGSEDGRALSLLSSSSSSPAQPFMPGLHYQQQRSMLVSDDDNLNSQETFQIGPNGPSLGGPHHRPFSPWD